MSNFAEDVFTDVECIVPVRCEPVEELEVGSWQQRKAKQGGTICGAIEGSRRSLKSIDKRVFANFHDKNAVFANFRDKNAVFTQQKLRF